MVNRGAAVVDEVAVLEEAEAEAASKAVKMVPEVEEEEARAVQEDREAVPLKMAVSLTLLPLKPRLRLLPTECFAAAVERC